MTVPNSGSPDHAYDRDQVLKIIDSVVSKVGENKEVSRDVIFGELKELQEIINEAREEIGANNPAEINDSFIPTATDELDAVVEATAEATGSIMDACEVIEDKAAAVGGENGDAISLEVTKIYEACSFQDITGQRITKTVSTLKQIEKKVGHLILILGGKLPGSSADSPAPAIPEDTRTGDEALLNGPQMADKAISQDDIDKLLAEFD